MKSLSVARVGRAGMPVATGALHTTIRMSPPGGMT